ncbi:MAG: hypothetical protein PUP92_21710 [Rhizonema sp. PD38]|nr:hypothetical protein [Rhizonema sp. PD38]
MSKITISNLHPEKLEYQEMPEVQKLSDTEQKGLLGGGNFSWSVGFQITYRF